VEGAIPYLRRAVELDPNFALGYAALTEAQLNLMSFTRTPQTEMFEAAKRSAERAIRIDPSLAEAQAAEAYVLQAQWDWGGAEEHFKKALSLKPGYAAARRRYAGLVMQFGRTEEGILLAQQAFSEDPYDRGAVPGIGMYYMLAGRFEDAIRFLETQIGESDMQGARHNLGEAYAEAATRADGQMKATYYTKALEQAARVMAIEKRGASADGFTPMADEMYSQFYTMMGNHSAAEPYFSRFRQEMNAGAASPALVAWIFALRGERNQALDLLEQAYFARDRRLLYIKMFPALASLHDEPRFQALVARMKL
jgi:tetratricopeptide (TPR) repeat protein